MTVVASAEVVGIQEPREFWTPTSAVSNGGDEAIDLAASAGLVLDPWQETALRAILGEKADGDWSAFETGVVVSRQNGKGGILEARELAGLFLLDEHHILHSAHEFKTAKEAYIRMRGLIEGAPHLLKLVKQFRQSNEDTSIELLSGARLRYMARSKSTGRGFTAKTLIVDEAQILSSAGMAAIMPTLASQPNPQIIYVGTVPRPEDDSEHFTKIRDRGRSGSDEYLAWLEWSAAEGLDGVDLDDVELWRQGNPALGYRIPLDFVRKERASMSDEDFARERMSIWNPGSTASVIPLAVWSAAEDTNPPEVSARGVAVDVAPDRSSAAVSFAGRRPDGRRHVELIETGEGVQWVAQFVADLVADHPGTVVVVDPGGPAGVLAEKLEGVGVTPRLASTRDAVHSSADLYDSILSGDLTHFGQVPLTAAAMAATKRKIGEGWAWGRSSLVDISPLVSSTLALYALSLAEKVDDTPRRSGKVW